MIARLGLRISEVFRRTAPDPFVLAVLLTVVTLVLAVTLTDTTPTRAVEIWSGTQGIWSAGILKFAMQMCLILVTGHALASSPPVSEGLTRLADLPRTAPQAVAIVALCACGLGVLNWGLGLIAGALLARRVGAAMQTKGIAVHYPLLAASGYLGLMVWHGGFSGSAPLKVTDAQQISDVLAAVPQLDTIAITRTILSPMNLVVTGGLVVLAPLLMALMSPREADALRTPDRFGVTRDECPAPSPSDPDKPLLPRLLEDTPIVTAILVSLIGWWAIRYYLPADGAPSGITRLTPDTVNLTMLMLGLILHGTPRRYVCAIERAAGSCAGIILQFPLYAGIMGVMTATGLSLLIASELTEHSSATTLPIVTFLSAGVVNMFVPSGGGQWAVQGPIAMRAAIDAGVDPAKMVMAVAYGDQLTNMLQPFWALPLLAITGVRARDIVGYTALAMIAAAAWITLWLLVF